MRAFSAVLGVGLLIAGCQCLAPVEELDGGEAGGSAAGGAGGGAAGGAAGGGLGGGASDGGGCTAAAQCSGAPAPPALCGVTFPPRFGCIEGRCVLECPQTGAGRTCRVNMGSYCLECGDAGTLCPLTGTTACGLPGPSGTVTVDTGATCTTWPGTTAPFEAVLLMRGASAQCRYLVSRPDGGANLGELWKLDNLEYVAFFPGFGGWCTGRSAFTGAPRGIITCPDCWFGLEGFE